MQDSSQHNSLGHRDIQTGPLWVMILRLASTLRPVWDGWTCIAHWVTGTYKPVHEWWFFVWRLDLSGMDEPAKNADTYQHSSLGQRDIQTGPSRVVIIRLASTLRPVWDGWICQECKTPASITHWVTGTYKLDRYEWWFFVWRLPLDLSEMDESATNARLQPA